MSTDNLRMDPHVVRILDNEEVVAAVELDDVMVALTPTRLIVADRQRLRLDLPIEQLHRVQLTVESDRPGLITFVPTTDRYPADLVLVPRHRFEETGQVVMAIGRVVAGTR
jgi:hypothetical protein